MTNVINEMICGTIDSTTGKINLAGEMKVTKLGILTSIQSGMVYDTSNTADPKRYLGSFNVQNDTMTPGSDKRSISINISDITMMTLVSTAILNCLQDIENKYKPTV